MKSWAQKWGVCTGLLLCFLVLELVFFNSAFLFHGDHERDLRLATVWVQHGEWPQSSPSISPLPFELGPLLYLVLAPAVVISPDPVFVRVYFLALASLGFALFFVTLRRELSMVGAGVALFALLSSTFSFEMSRQLWHSSLLPIPVAGFVLASHQQRGFHVETCLNCWDLCGSCHPITPHGLCVCCPAMFGADLAGSCPGTQRCGHNGRRLFGGHSSDGLGLLPGHCGRCTGALE